MVLDEALFDVGVLLDLVVEGGVAAVDKFALGKSRSGGKRSSRVEGSWSPVRAN